MQEVGLEQVRCGLYLEVVAGGGAGVVSCPASFHSHAEEKSLVKCLFNFCSVNYDVMLVVYDVFNVAMCANDLMWQVNEADCLSFAIIHKRWAICQQTA